MPQSTKLTDKEKQNCKHKLLIHSTEIQELMEPIAFEDFTKLVAKNIPPSQARAQETK